MARVEGAEFLKVSGLMTQFWEALLTAFGELETGVSASVYIGVLLNPEKMQRLVKRIDELCFDYHKLSADHANYQYYGLSCSGKPRAEELVSVFLRNPERLAGIGGDIAAEFQAEFPAMDILVVIDQRPMRWVGKSSEFKGVAHDEILGPESMFLMCSRLDDYA